MERLIEDLRLASFTNKAPIWKDLAVRLARPNRHVAEINLSRLSRIAKKGEVVVVPGKVLGSGELDKELSIAAVKASKTARSKIAKAGGRLMDLAELVAENPKGSGVRIVE